MAEIGIIASVIGVAGCGFRLSLLLNAVGCEIASAGIEIHSISKGVTLFSLMLKQVGQALQEPASVHSSEALETAQEITNECQLVFDEIQDMLDKVATKRPDGSSTPSVQQRFKWCFKKARVQYLLGQLESLKMSMMVMLQILQLGKLMASTPRQQVDEKPEAAPRNDTIAQERAEAQNMVIVRYWQISRLDRLFAAAEDEEAEEQDEAEHLANSTANYGQLAIEAPSEYYRTSTALVRLPIVSLGELDTTLNQIRDSPREMLRVSDYVIDPLLRRWTRSQEPRDQAEASSQHRYAPTVHNLNESDEEKRVVDEDLYDREDSSRGYLLEGSTDDWRKPHSAEARKQAIQNRKKYAFYQPSVSLDSSEEDDRASRRSKGRASSKYAIDSGSETSDSEPELPRQRPEGTAPTSNDTRAQHSMPSWSAPAHSHSTSQESRASFGGRNSSPPQGTPLSTPRSSVSMPRSPGAHRPIIHPAQSPVYPHSYTSPVLPLQNSNAPSLYPHSPYSPTANPSLQPYPPPYQAHNTGQHGPPRYLPTQGYRIPGHGQPPMLPYDGRPLRPPSRSSRRSSHSHRSIEDLRKSEKSRKHKNLKKSATKGILGASALAGFLEALEGLEL